MPDLPLERPKDALPVEFPRSKGSSQLRLVTAEDAIVFPEDAEPTDDTPTIISKNKPAEDAKKTTAPQLTSGLRGRRLAHFELLEPIGVGGMAAVIRARDMQLDRFVALKILPPDMAQDDENVRRFHQEARAAAKLDHENIARVYFCGEDQRLYFIAFEFVEGENLRVVLERRGRLPVGEAVRIVLQIATGLEHAAARGVVHRDVKPSNIILSSNGRAKLVDMGLARSLEPHNDQGLTHSGVTLGTFDYISPEQALEPREADSRSDLYSLGCTLYHMLTGQPPVPDGTAAKKLHHHQHVPPVDPRQFNPDIPDEVAAILGRMMAKDPKDRYQRPVHLVQHLMQVAQKVGAGDNAPEGVLFVDAALPGAPHKRPLLLISLAALGLAALLVLLSLGQGRRQPIGEPWLPRAAEKKPGGKDTAPDKKGNAGVADVRNSEVKSAEDLALALTNKWPKAILKNDIDLGDVGLTFYGTDNDTFECSSLNPNEPSRIRVKHQPRSEPPDLAAGIIVNGGVVVFRNIVFELESRATPEIPIAALAIKGAGTVKFQGCTFVQPKVVLQPFIGPNVKVVPMACVLVDNPAGVLEARCQVTLEGCYFSGGQVAVAINGPVDLVASDCAFKPYSALFHLRGHTGDFGASLKLQHCSAFVMHGPAFRLDQDASCTLALDHSIFSRPETVFLGRADQPNLIHQTNTIKPAVRFEGVRNCYHNLNSLWVREEVDRNTPPELLSRLDDDFREFLEKKTKGSKGDIGSAQLPASVKIWASPAWQEDFPEAAFHLNPEVREVRTADLKGALGVRKFREQKMAALPPLPDEPKVAIKLRPNERLVDPDDTGETPRVFKNVHSALANALPGDVILIKEGKKGREIEVSPSRLDSQGVDVTLKPYPGHSPLLIMPDTSEDDAAFFRIFDGKMAFEQLEFVLEPDQSGFKSQSVALIGGNASCVFRNCVMTLKAADRLKPAKRIPVSVVTLIDPDDAMKMAPRTQRTSAELWFHHCFVRGDGDLLHVRASRPADITVDNTLVALTGSLFQAFGAAKDAAPEHAATLRLNNVSAFTVDPHVALRAGKNVKGLVLTKVEPRDSLFAPLADRPLVLLESSETTEDGLQPFLEWKGERNAYCAFDKYLECRRPDDLQASLMLDAVRWADLYREPGGKYSRVPAFQVNAKQLWTALPEHFAPRLEFKDELSAFGANLKLEHLPKLTAGK